jgi:hypothetical protein
MRCKRRDPGTTTYIDNDDHVVATCHRWSRFYLASVALLLPVGSAICFSSRARIILKCFFSNFWVQDCKDNINSPNQSIVHPFYGAIELQCR